MSILFFIANLFVISFLIWKLHHVLSEEIYIKIWLPALTLKILCGIGLGLLYSAIYESGDTWNFFHESSRLSDLARTDFKSYLDYIFFNNNGFESAFKRNPGAGFLVKLTSVLNLATHDNYWLINTYFSIFAFFGLSQLVVTLKIIDQKYKLTIYIAFFFWPSFVFWSSGLSKEALAIGAIGVLIAQLFKWIYTDKSLNWKQMLFGLLMFALLWKVKYYYAAVFLLITTSFGITSWLSSRFKLKPFIVQLSLFFFTGTLITLIVSTIHPNFEFQRLREIIVLTHDIIIAKSEPDEVIHFTQLTSEPTSLLFNSPLAFFSGIYRPLIWDSAFSGLKLLAAIENTVLLLLSISAFFFIPFKIGSKSRLLLLAGLGYCVILSVLLALSTPNFGTLIRYRVGFHGFAILLVLMANSFIINRACEYLRSWISFAVPNHKKQ